MGVYISNEDMPEDCYTCFCYETEFNMCSLTGKRLDNIRIRRDDCPLLDIVRCGECEYKRKYALRSDEPTGIWCHRWSVPRLVTEDDFCSYGERRSDDKTEESRP